MPSPLLSPSNLIPLALGAVVVGLVVSRRRRAPTEPAPILDDNGLPIGDDVPIGGGDGGGGQTALSMRVGDHVEVPEAALTSTQYGLGLEPRTKQIWGIQPGDTVVIKIAPGVGPAATRDRVNGIVVGGRRANGQGYWSGQLDPRWGPQGRSFTFARSAVTKVTPREQIPPLPVNVGDLVEVEVRSITSPPGIRLSSVYQPWQHVHIHATEVTPSHVRGTIPNPLEPNAIYSAPRYAVLSATPPPAASPPGGPPIGLGGGVPGELGDRCRPGIRCGVLPPRAINRSASTTFNLQDINRQTVILPPDAQVDIRPFGTPPDPVTVRTPTDTAQERVSFIPDPNGQSFVYVRYQFPNNGAIIEGWMDTAVLTRI